MGVFDLVGLLSSGKSIVISVCDSGMWSGCCGSVTSQYPRLNQLLTGIAAFAHVHKCVELVLCLKSLYHWLFKNPMGLNSLVGEYFFGM